MVSFSLSSKQASFGRMVGCVATVVMYGDTFLGWLFGRSD